jgi:hypothetical protein
VPDPDDVQNIADGWKCPSHTLLSGTGFCACIGGWSGVILTFLLVEWDLIGGTACVGYKIRFLPVFSVVPYTSHCFLVLFTAQCWEGHIWETS